MATILVVDDDPDTQETLNIWLTNDGFEVLTDPDGQQAVHTAATRQPSLILLDVMLPNLSGLELCKQLRVDPRTRHIPVMLMTAYDPAVSRVEALMAGASDYIPKPLKLDDLHHQIETLLAAGASADQGGKLLNEITTGTLSIVSCNLTWLLTIDDQRSALVSASAAASKGESALRQFLEQATQGVENGIPLAKDSGMLASVALTGAAIFNEPLSHMRESGDRAIYEACVNLDLYFVSLLPLAISGSILGVLLLGTRAPLDVDTTHGQELLAAVSRQAAMAIHNARLMLSLAERESESTEERLFRETLLDTMTDGLAVYTPDGMIRYANRRLSLMTGYPVETLSGMDIRDLFDPETRSPLDGLVGNPEQGKTRSLELALRRADGRDLPVLAVQASTLISRGGLLSGSVIVVTDLSRQKSRERALTKQSHRLEALSRATQIISSTLSFDRVIHTILLQARDALEATLALNLRLHEESQQFAIQAAVGPGAEKVQGLSLPLLDGLVGRATQEKTALLLSGADESIQRIVDAHTGLTTRSAAAVPVLVDDEVAGVVLVTGDREDAFDKADLDILTGLSRSAAIAIRNARLYADARRHVRELRLLLGTSETASSTLAIEHVVEAVARHLIGTLAVQWCRISSWDEQRQMFGSLAEVADIVWKNGEGKRLSLTEHSDLRAALDDCHPFVLPGLQEPEREALFVPVCIAGVCDGLVELWGAQLELYDQAHVEPIISAWRGTLTSRFAEAPREVLRHISARLLRETKSDCCVIYAVDPETTCLNTLHFNGKVVWPLGTGPGRLLQDDALRQIALTNHQPIAARLESEVNRPAAERSLLAEQRDGVLLMAPLTARGTAIGLVELIDPDGERQFTDSDLSLARAIGNVVGNALENARLYTALLQRASQLEAAYTELQEADRLKAEWIQNVSHELRTPLTTILGYIELMREGDLGPVTDKQLQGLTVMGSKSRQLAGLVDDILAIQQLENADLDRTVINLTDLARAAIYAMQQPALEGKITLQAEFEDDLPDVYIDSQRMLKALENLIENGIKFSPEGGVIVIRIEDIGPALQVCVSDEGIGIAPDDHDKVWRRFYQVDGSMTRQYGGAGLGLSIVKQVVEKHGGRVWVESTPGEGSQFYFMLPKVDPQDFQHD